MRFVKKHVTEEGDVSSEKTHDFIGFDSGVNKGDFMNSTIIKHITVVLILVTLINTVFNSNTHIVNAEQYEYDSLGRVAKVIHDDKSITLYEYDSLGNIIKITNQDSDKSDFGERIVPQDNSIASSGTSGNSGNPGNVGTPKLPLETSSSDSSMDASSYGKNDNKDNTSDNSSNDTEITTTTSDNLRPSESTTTETTEDTPASDSNSVLYGQRYTIGVLIYQIRNASTKVGTVSVVGVKKSKRKRRSYTIPKTVKIKGHKYKVTSIGKKAFSKCKKCRVIRIKSKTIVSIHKTAFMGLKKGLKIKVPRSKYKKYKKMLKKCKGIKRLIIRKSIF